MLAIVKNLLWLQRLHIETCSSNYVEILPPAMNLAIIELDTTFDFQENKAPEGRPAPLFKNEKDIYYPQDPPSE